MVVPVAPRGVKHPGADSTRRYLGRRTVPATRGARPSRFGATPIPWHFASRRTPRCAGGSIRYRTRIRRIRLARHDRRFSRCTAMSRNSFPSVGGDVIQRRKPTAVQAAALEPRIGPAVPRIGSPSRQCRFQAALEGGTGRSVGRPAEPQIVRDLVPGDEPVGAVTGVQSLRKCTVPVPSRAPACFARKSLAVKRAEREAAVRFRVR